MSEQEADFEKVGQEARISAYYSALTNAWISTKFEKDKSLLTISAGAIGLLVTLLTTLEIPSLCLIGCFFFAFILFIITIICIIFVFERNAKHIENVLNDKDDDDKILKILDRTIVFCFIFGIIFTVIIGTVYGIDKHNKKKEPVVTEKKITSISKDGKQQSSLREISKLKPQPPKNPQKGK